MEIYVDEAWRWPLAWPVRVGAVLPLSRFSKKLFRDSKQLTENKRNICYDHMQTLAQSGKILFASWFASNKEIDRNGIIRSLRRSIIRALFTIAKEHPDLQIPTHRWCYLKKLLSLPNDTLQLTIDGNHTFGLDTWRNTTTIIKWDQKNPFISMASIVAKVERDRWMTSQDTLFPDYWFAQHKGYGTQQHREAIKSLWPTPLHRTTFISNLI